jgi:hypothetical protein
MPAKVSSFTVSTSFDTHRNGSKHTHFLSMNFVFPEPITPEEAEAEAMKASFTVSKSCYKQALARGQMTVEEVNERIQDLKTNHDALLVKAAKAPS